jgi:release factor glutamine methyltransferase
MMVIAGISTKNLEQPYNAVTVSQVASRLHCAGVCSPIVNAQEMLCCVLDLRVVDLYTERLSLTAEEYILIEKMIARRISGEPLQYIIGKANFYGYDIVVKNGVFIPRPETEILVDAVIDYIKNRKPQTAKRKPLILDLCTGSGNIAISLTKVLTHCKIKSSDISEAALKIASENAKHHGVSEKISFINADLLSIPSEYEKAFDVIVCNPPYVRQEDIKVLSDEVKHDPIEALNGGVDGLDFYRRIVKYAGKFLKENGFIALEIPDNSESQIGQIIESSGDFSDIKFFKDLNGIDRVVAARFKKIT